MRLLMSMGFQLYAVDQVLAERARQDKKWGPQDHPPEWWLAILMEEVGELAETILHGKFGGTEASNRDTELTQVAAVALAWLESITRRNADEARRLETTVHDGGTAGHPVGQAAV